MSIQLADKLYKEYGVISICNDGKFVDFGIEKENDRNSGNC